MTQQAGGLITVRLDVAAEHEAEFKDWYTLEHVPQLTAMPGFVRTRRYICRTWNSDAADIRDLAAYKNVLKIKFDDKSTAQQGNDAKK